MNACFENAEETKKNISISVTYNVNIGVDRMNNHTDETAIEASNQTKFENNIKVGIYKSMHSDGVMSKTELIRFIGLIEK